MIKGQIDPVAGIILFFSIVIFSFVNKNIYLLIFLSLGLLYFLFRKAKERRILIKFFLLLLFIAFNSLIASTSMMDGFRVDLRNFVHLFLRVTTLTLLLINISLSAGYKGILSAFYKFKFPSTLLEITAISFMALSLLRKNAEKILQTMNSRNLFSKLRWDLYSTGLFIGLLFRKMIDDTKYVSLVAQSRCIDSFYPFMLEERETNKKQIVIFSILGFLLVLLGLHNG